MTTIRELEKVEKRIWALVDALPQRDLIQMSDARQWIGEVINQHGEMAVWHAIRLSGFGGSEIGVLVRNRAGVRGDHQASAHDIVLSKLMRSTPDEDSGHLRRGHAFEPIHAEHFYKKYHAKRDEVAYEQLKAAVGKYVWMRYSPDDVVTMPGGYFSGRWLADYKAPSQVDDADTVSFQYACQLTQGAILCAESGIELKGLMLSQFDWAGWRLKDDIVAWDENLGKMVLDAGDFYWTEHVMKGDAPAFIFRQKMEGIDDFVKEFLPLAQQLASLKALEKAIKERAELARSDLLSKIGDVRLSNQKLVFGSEGATDLTLAAKRMIDKDAVRKILSPEQLLSCKKSGEKDYDEKAMALALKELGGNPDLFAKFALDADKVFAVAQSIELDSEALIEEQLTVSPGRHHKEMAEHYVSTHFPRMEQYVDEPEPEHPALAPP